MGTGPSKVTSCQETNGHTTNNFNSQVVLCMEVVFQWRLYFYGGCLVMEFVFFDGCVSMEVAFLWRLSFYGCCLFIEVVFYGGCFLWRLPSVRY